MRPILQEIPQVALLLPAAVKISRDMRRGILTYIHQHGPWSLHIIDGRIGGQNLFCPEEWGCAGLIGRIFKPEQETLLRSLRVPMVLVDTEEYPLPPDSLFTRVARLRCDTQAVGTLAAEYFLQKHYTHFAYVNEIRHVRWSLRRGEAFSARIRKEGFDCAIYPPRTEGQTSIDSGAERQRLAEWLAALPKPVAVYAANDSRGRQLFDVAALAKLSIPNDLAILGTDNDEDLCETTSPPMSSILLNAEQAAFEAAATLDAAMRTGMRPRGIISYGPNHVIERNSTVGTRLNDAFVSRALDFIALNATSGITVKDVVANVHVSRRFLELHFRAVLGRTILAEIQRACLEHVSLLLRETATPINEIVATSGFESQGYLSLLFKKHFGCSMRAWRTDKNREPESK